MIVTKYAKVYLKKYLFYLKVSYYFPSKAFRVYLVGDTLPSDRSSLLSAINNSWSNVNLNCKYI